VSAGSEFPVELCSEEPADVGCRVFDLENGALLFERAVTVQDAPTIVTMSGLQPGLYRIEADAGGGEPVEDTLLVV
jgi:hypothetical protein